MSKQILFDEDARLAVLRGIEKLSRAVRVTMGPKGRNVVIENKPNTPIITKDGITVAGAINLPERSENVGAGMLKEIAEKTAEAAGDGTTTAIVLAEIIYRESFKNITSGSSPMVLKRGIEKAVKAVVEELGKMAKPIQGKTETVQIATIASNNDVATGNLVARAIEKSGKTGVITVEESQSMESSIEIVEGMRFDQGYVSPYFVTDANKMEAVLDDPYIFICEKKIRSLSEVLPIMENCAESSRSLLVIAEDVEGEALSGLVINKTRGILYVCAVKAPGFGDQRRVVLQDIAILTGGTVLTDDLGIKFENVTLKDLGQAKRVVVNKNNTTIIGGSGDKNNIDARIKQIQKELNAGFSVDERKQIEERLGKLSGGITIMRIGAATETEMKEKKYRIEDALHATRAALEEGVVVGGGVALVRAARILENLILEGDEITGANIVRRALEEPFRTIVENSGISGTVALQKVREGEGFFGYNAEAGKYEDLVKAGIIDPKKVTRLALENAASIASIFVASEAVVVEQEENNSLNSHV